MTHKSGEARFSTDLPFGFARSKWVELDSGVTGRPRFVVASLEMLSGRSKQAYAQEAQAVADAPDGAPTTNCAAAEDLEAVVAM